MSASLSSPKCEKDPQYCTFGAETLIKLVEALDAQIDPVIKSEDIECVHKMRVASRRTRAAMPLFRICFAKKTFKSWLREIKKVTRLLGEARDIDVQIAFIQQYTDGSESPTERAVVDLLRKSREDWRKEIQATVVAGLQELKDSHVLTDMNEFCTQMIERTPKTRFETFCVLEKVHRHISSKLDDFLVMEEYVHRENEILKHHEMRIRAKWLRYTMEVFSPLFKSKLRDEINTIKNFQDVLGEMHDCDVLIYQIPKFRVKGRAEIKSKNKKAVVKRKKALQKFLAYVKEKRRDLYDHFVKLWDACIDQDFFERLRETTNTEATINENKIRQALSNPKTKIAVLADIHANLHALETVFQDAEKRGADVFLNAGDSIGFGPFPNEVVELLRYKNVISVIGNYDLEAVKKLVKGKNAKGIAYEFAKKELANSCKSYLLSLPREVRLEIAGKKLLMVHGSPESIDEHIRDDTSVERLKTLAAAAKADVVVAGHSHEQLCREVNGVSFINPGSTGRPSDGNPQAAYAIMNLFPIDFDFVRLDYDVKAAANALRKKKLPESFAQMLLRGVALETITEEDNARKDSTLRECEEVIQNSRRVSRKYQVDTEHCEQVRKVALRFFDGLDSLHRLGRRERCWLECAAVLHDIGLSEGASSHHKKSMRLILDDTELILPSEERRIVASIVRYHRKGFPKQKHFNLASLSRATVRKITILSSFLRVADALDYSHRSLVESVNVKVGPKRVTVECIVPSSSPLEEQAFNKKKDLLENLLKKNLVLVWKLH
jgi:putative phosphoesterase